MMAEMKPEEIPKDFTQNPSIRVVQPERPREEIKLRNYTWVIYALLSSLSSGICLFLMSRLSTDIGFAGSFPMCFGFFIMGLIYQCVKDSTT